MQGDYLNIIDVCVKQGKLIIEKWFIYSKYIKLKEEIFP
jgi:hypothetical protein